MDILEALLDAPAFSHFPQKELALLARAMTIHRCAAGETLITAGDRPEAVFVVLQGSLEVWIREEDRSRRAVSTLGPGDLCGLMALVEKRRRSASVTALEDTVLARLPAREFDLLYQSGSPMSLHFQMLVARRLVRDARRINEALLAATVAGTG
jgi:CRP/FNR family cyclic AMP-dependent transcriptional regulator